MANYHKRNSIRAVQWAPENAQSFEDIKKLVAENPGLGWKVRDNIIHNCVTKGKKNSLFIVPPETFELMYKSDESRKW